MLFNVNILGNTTPDSFKIVNTNEYNKRIHMGVKEMMRSKVVFCALLRDTENMIPSIIEKVEYIGSFFKDYAVLIVENDSSDNTRTLLLEWSKKNPRVVILGCGYNVDVCKLQLPKTVGHNVGKSRIDKMAKLRNIYIDEIKKNYNDFDYTIMWDLDILGVVYLDGIANTFGYLTKIKNPSFYADGICAYGFFKTPLGNLYADSYAHIDEGDNFHIDTKFIHDIKKRIQLHDFMRGETPIKCESCFSGFTIYRIKSIIENDAKYESSSDDNVVCEHVFFNRYLPQIYFNPSMLYVILKNDN